MKQIKLFWCSEANEEAVNSWLQNNANVEIVDIKIALAAAGADHPYGGTQFVDCPCIMIVYEKAGERE